MEMQNRFVKLQQLCVPSEYHNCHRVSPLPLGRHPVAVETPGGSYGILTAQSINIIIIIIIIIKCGN